MNLHRGIRGAPHDLTQARPLQSRPLNPTTPDTPGDAKEPGQAGERGDGIRPTGGAAILS
jgi:hypothetical protein